MRLHQRTSARPLGSGRPQAVQAGAALAAPACTVAPPGPGRSAPPPEPGRDPSIDRIEAVYRERHAPMVRMACMLVGSRALAEELVHDSFIKLHGALDRVEGDPGAYLRSIVVNQCHSHLRRRRVEQHHARPDDRVSLPPELDEVWDRLRSLPERRRTALVLRFYEDMSIDETATAMGVRPGTVKSLVHRGLAAMREELS